MNLNSVVRGGVAITACMAAGMLLPDCKQATPTVTGSGGAKSGGSGGQAGQSTSSTDPSSAGGTGGGDASVLFKLDVIPAWWGELDAPQQPDTPPAPTGDANCGNATSQTTRQRVDVLLVLDRSASMDWSLTDDCSCTKDGGAGAGFGTTVCKDTTNCTTRWNSVQPAVKTTLTTSKYVNWGLKFFPSDPTSNCGVTATMEVPIETDPSDSAQSKVQSTIQTQVDSAQLSLGTPTAAAISAATAYLKTVKDSNNKVILVATDGEPNCGGTPASINNVDLTGADAAATAANTAGFPVYVVGIGPTVANLTQLAAAGGTKDFYPVSSPDQLSAALTSISKQVGSCTFKVQVEQDKKPDWDNIAVYFNKQLVVPSGNDGWTVDAGSQEVVLTGKYCDDITAGKDTTVEILFGCPGAPPFPPFVP